jgi:GTP-binding protein
VVPVSGATGEGIEKLMGALFRVRQIWSKRISTAKLNCWLEQALERTPPPAVAGRRIKIRFITQLRARPPYFIIFGNQLEALPASYERFLVNGLRQAFDLPGVPIRISKKTGPNPFAPKRSRSK